MEDCEPVQTNKEMGKVKAYDGTTTLTPDAPAYPCGLIAKSFFTDRFKLFKIDDQGVADTTPIGIDTTKISWDTDREFKFKNLDGDWKSKQWLNVEDPHF